MRIWRRVRVRVCVLFFLLLLLFEHCLCDLVLEGSLICADRYYSIILSHMHWLASLLISVNVSVFAVGWSPSLQWT